ncbi:MAG: electron transfer flavoprotein subunit beta/FixA family protein [Gammaproteobacteria bacterium]|nr:electron transfer flavoprotein subunit beta/FixA family protein [Gammaproteobacteria bacterium]
MKILVPVKRVIDHNVNIRVKPDGSSVVTDNVRMSMNPFDEVAIEAGVRLKESGQADEVIAVTIGNSKCEETLRTALAMGADRAVLVEYSDPIEPLSVAKILKQIAEKEAIGLAILGKQAIDDDANQTGQMLSALLGCSQATFASSIQLNTDSHTANVVREIDGGTQTVQVTLPSIITVDLRLNTPRFASLPNIMKAKKKPIEKYLASDFNLDLSPRLSVLSVREAEKRKTGTIVTDVAELVKVIENQNDKLGGEK